jgi:hypothetical protein
MKGDARFTGGAGLVVLAFLVTVVSPYWVAVSIPAYLVGALMVALSDQRRILKVATILAPVAFVLPASRLFNHLYLSLGPDPIPETYLIPSGMTGQVLIIRNEECGIEPRLENGRWVLEIPHSQILIVRSDVPTGVIDQEYVVIGAGGGRTLVSRTPGRPDSSQEITVEASGRGSTGGPDGCAFTYTSLLVRRVGEPLRPPDDELFAVACSLVVACRSGTPTAGR